MARRGKWSGYREIGGAGCGEQENRIAGRNSKIKLVLNRSEGNQRAKLQSNPCQKQAGARIQKL
jgi:hypothetical protein